jgi:hypothetical protein
VAAAGLGIAALLWPPPEQPRAPEPVAPAAVPAPPAPSAQVPPSAPAVTGTPAALRVAFARDVKGILPIDEGETFYRDDRKVVLWVRWANVRGKHSVATRWFDANGEPVHTPRPETFDSPADFWATWTTLPLRRGMVKAPGQWRAEVYLDRKPVLTAHVTVLDQPRPRAGR